MAEIKYYVLDTETNGVRDNFHEVTQISIIRCEDRVQLNRYIKPEHPERTSPDALKYTGRTMADLEKGDPRKQVVEFCNKFFEEDGVEPEYRCIVGHNIWSFDKRFLHATWGADGLQFPANLWFDTLHYVKEYMRINDIKGKANLTAACELVGIKPKDGAHNAVVDTQNNYRLWKALTDKYKVPTILKDGTSILKRFAHTVE